MSTIMYVRISDPWDLGETLNWPLMKGHLEEFDSSSTEPKFIFILDQEFTYKNEKYRIFLVSPRYVGEKLPNVFLGTPVTCGFESIGSQPNKTEHVVYDRRLGFIGSLSLSKNYGAN